MTALQFSRPLLIGVVHLGACPGAPRFGGDISALLDAARRDAAALAHGGADAVIVENFGDAPFHPGAVPAETIATLALALDAVTREVRGGAGGGLPVGVNVLRNDARAALGLCAATGAGFLRVNVHTGAAVTDQGLIEGRAWETLRERARLAPEAQLLADVHVKHAVPLGGGSLEDAAADTFERGGADALVISGAGTGLPTARRDLERVRERLAEAPLLVGSGVTEETAAELLGVASGAIVGTWLKRGGEVGAPVDAARVARLRARFDAS